MGKQTTPRTRERQASRDAAARRATERADRRRRIIGIAAVFVVLLAVAGTVFAAANDKGDQAAKASTTTSTSALPGDNPTTSVASGPTVSVTPAAAGATISGPTPCPAEDGSSPRTTLFAEPPPTCVDKAVTYDAVISTSVGDLTVLLNSDLAPTAVNNFVVLALYHYYDGAPLSTIISRTVAEVGSDNAAPDGRQSPGYTLPGDHPPAGTIFPPGTILMVKVPNQGDRFAGAFQVALGEKAADLPVDSTAFGLTLDGSDTLRAIDRAGSPEGGPTQVITITSVRITRPAVTTTTTTAG